MKKVFRMNKNFTPSIDFKQLLQNFAAQKHVQRLPTAGVALSNLGGGL